MLLQPPAVCRQHIASFITSRPTAGLKPFSAVGLDLQVFYMASSRHSLGRHHIASFVTGRRPADLPAF
jgi:hypothetical protein